ncbi:hypothetical protein FZC74_14960 [Sutcliffiella horikoshii]|uniref:Uncharacterized protein n=1 Tax=Sutcliffiella horikoshii TaxID=79883 RepID=A0AA95B5U5_9BACI|nr:hypothetical protein [Sutcliffiella horikoshii]TYS57727.1 hypothetical protein FZC74_14960 [Sutcliffiella horikoshii]
MIKIAENFVKSFGLNVKIEDWNGSLGNYNREKDIISLNIQRIRKIYSHHRDQIPYIKSTKDYIILITCHELGHRDDEQELKPVSVYFDHITEGDEEKLFLVEEYCNEIMDKVLTRCVEREVTAWELGKSYVNPDRIEDYNVMNEKYIKEKRQSYLRDTDEIINLKIKMLHLKIQKEVELEQFNKAMNVKGN